MKKFVLIVCLFALSSAASAEQSIIEAVGCKGQLRKGQTQNLSAFCMKPRFSEGVMAPHCRYTCAKTDFANYCPVGTYAQEKLGRASCVSEELVVQVGLAVPSELCPDIARRVDCNNLDTYGQGEFEKAQVICAKEQIVKRTFCVGAGSTGGGY